MSSSLTLATKLLQVSRDRGVRSSSPVSYAGDRWFKSNSRYQILQGDKVTAKKSAQLGMNVSTATGRLTKDIMWRLIVQTNQNMCFHCGKEMTREDFSIEHKVPWLDSENPQDLFFDLDNIAFSHLSCNVAAARKPNKGIIPHGTSSGYDTHKCRCDACKAAKAARRKKEYTPEKRRSTYERTGK